MIPKAVIQLNEPHTSLGKAPGHQAGAAEIVRLLMIRIVNAVEFLLRRRSRLCLDHRGQFALHAVSQFVGLDYALERVVHTVSDEAFLV